MYVLRMFSFMLVAGALSACAAVIGIPDPTLDETAGPGGEAGRDGAVVEEASRSDAPADREAPDATVDGGGCNDSVPWGNIAHLDSLASISDEDQATLSADERTIYFRRSGNDDGGEGGSYIFVATRGNTAAPFGPPSKVPLFAEVPLFIAPCVTAGKAVLYYAKVPDVREPHFDIFSVTMPGVAGDRSEPLLNTRDSDFCGSFAGDGSMVTWRQSRDQNVVTFYEASLAGAQFTTPQPLEGFGATGLTLLGRPVISANGLTIFYEATKATILDPGIYTARRPTKGAAFAGHTLVTELSSPGADGPAWLSPDSCRIYFSSVRPGGRGQRDLYVASRGKGP